MNYCTLQYSHFCACATVHVLCIFLVLKQPHLSKFNQRQKNNTKLISQKILPRILFGYGGHYIGVYCVV